MTMLKAAGIAIGLGLAWPALAQGPMNAQQQAEYKRNCTADYSRLCSNHAPDSMEVQLCFQRRLSEVSPRCRATIAKFRGG